MIDYDCNSYYDCNHHLHCNRICSHHDITPVNKMRSFISLLHCSFHISLSSGRFTTAIVSKGLSSVVLSPLIIGKNELSLNRLLFCIRLNLRYVGLNLFCNSISISYYCYIYSLVFFGSTADGSSSTFIKRAHHVHKIEDGIGMSLFILLHCSFHISYQSHRADSRRYRIIRAEVILICLYW